MDYSKILGRVFPILREETLSRTTKERKKRFSNMKLILPVPYLLPPIGLFCFAVYFYYLFITPSQPLHLSEFVSTINQSSLSASKLPVTPTQPLHLPEFVSTINQSSLSATKLPGIYALLHNFFSLKLHSVL